MEEVKLSIGKIEEMENGKNAQWLGTRQLVSLRRTNCNVLLHFYGLRHSVLQLILIYLLTTLSKLT